MTGATHVRRPCPCCGTPAAEALFHNRMAPIGGLDMSYRVARCGRCNFAYANELAPASHYDYYYRNFSKYDVIPSTDAVPAVARLRAEAVTSFCERHVRRGEAVADLGCGAGVLLSTFHRRGWQALHGLDPAPGAPAQARQLFGLDGVHAGTLSEAGQILPLDQIGLVCLTGVLEHLPELRTDLVELFDRLRPGTRILVEVPAMERFLEAPSEPYGEFSLEHIQYFSAVTLAQLFTTLGASPIELEILDLPAGTTDSLLGLFEVGTGRPAPRLEQHDQDDRILTDYLRQSQQTLEKALARLAACTAHQIVVYGAGSHTARLLPHLVRMGLGSRIVAIMDGNPNLHGQTFGSWRIEAPETMRSWPDATVVISSFRAQSSIAEALAQAFPNHVLQLY